MPPPPAPSALGPAATTAVGGGRGGHRPLVFRRLGFLPGAASGDGTGSMFFFFKRDKIYHEFLMSGLLVFMFFDVLSLDYGGLQQYGSIWSCAACYFQFML